MSDATFAAEPPKKRSTLGCFLGGCFGVLLLGIVALVAIGFLGWRFAAGQIEKITSDTPRDLPVVEYSDEEMQVLEDQLEKINHAADSGEVAEPMILTADDLNALLAGLDDPDLKGKIHVSIENNQISAEVSVPIDMLPGGNMIPGGKGRYFNGSATADVSLDDGYLVVRVADAEVNGEPVPANFIEGVRQQNLVEDANRDPEFAKILKRFDKVEIVDDKVILTPAGSGGLLQEPAETEDEIEPISP
ncbi:MAG: hypothetical protein KDB27_22720 [Planctomycetales bacterium]|nr:hypothetical protein [Planctomycetales bacterium]